VNSALPDNVSLQVFVEGQVIFQSSGTWLYPLFDLEDYLRDHPQETAKIFISDKVVGKAAALMMIRLAVGRVHGELMSELAVDVFTRHHVPHTYDVLGPPHLIVRLKRSYWKLMIQKKPIRSCVNALIGVNRNR